ncbi:hypothetical protein GE21DRAFT_6607 [Neurospora crassa]|uniref:DUF7136 domain-containing protein n=1 Tax=Neurospora crassa (strain ATCC 24698 / 74-OR23-1A / CBS 708.71 / DSM 1257 / FGSC 987) TaxID=367110 RepID=Q7S8L6_NEUCR|nr:hypothetical protein NCU05318 [Neurospora crassa OR74A]EAA32695.3 hypothetical protein NCU05318 [Neurospora crassa OR74A]KHE84921.1 hypothetical protein GE21DRAFT_6607 [Neurospora crassa]|eukprot:XP_961931.3 hypothetical protein NCU05318 [Neurospora crassa OR74A]
MHVKPWTAWSLLASLVSFWAVADAADSGILEVDLLFPRNETYAPTEWIPYIFSIQNAKLAKYLLPEIRYDVWNLTEGGNSFGYTHQNLQWANWSSHDPYFVHHFHSGLHEGRWRLNWEFWYISCNEDLSNLHSSSELVNRNRTVGSIEFTIQEGGPAVDVVAATANDKTCSEGNGAAINITGKTKEVAPFGIELTDDTCVVVGSPQPTPTPCQVKVDSAVAASISASWTAHLCDDLITEYRPANCPDDKDNAAQRLAVAGVACLAVAVGMFGFLA